MAEINIKLIYNLETGKKDIFIDFESDADALPIEHEDAHRDIVEQLIGQKVVMEEEIGQIHVQRVQPQNQSQSSEDQQGQDLPEQEAAGNS